MSEERKITDADVDAIAEAIREKMLERFYQDLGYGVWFWIKRGIFGAVMVLAAWGAYKSHQ
jgi:hypothetical protein